MRTRRSGLAGVVLAIALAGSLAACSVEVAAPAAEPSGCGAGPFGASPACSFGPTGAPGGKTREAAILLALRAAPHSTRLPTVVWAAVENDPYDLAASSGGGLVWEVRLEGPMTAPPCPSGMFDRMPSQADPPCLDATSGVIVVLDYFSGRFLGWLH